MNNNERSAVLKRLTATLKKHFTVILPDMNRSVLEQLVFSICLENASYSSADEVFLALTHNFFDWNEVRVSSSRELAETMKDLPEPAQTGLRLKRILHQIFDQKYNFDLEEIRKMGMKQVNEYMEKIENVTPFNVAYITQTILDRHSIPISSGEFEILDILGLVDNKDREANTVGWLERAVDKKSGPEFFSLIHQLGALYTKNPYGRKFQEIMLAVDPSCKSRLPKRRKDSNDLELSVIKPSTANSSAARSSDKSVPAAEAKSTATPKPATSKSVEAKPAEEKSGKTPAKKFESKPLASKLTMVKGKKTADGASASIKDETLVPATEKKAVEKKAVEKKSAEKKTPEKKGAREVKTEAKSGSDKSSDTDKPAGKGKSTAKESATKEPVTKESTTKESTTKEPTTKESTTKEPVTKESAKTAVKSVKESADKKAKTEPAKDSKLKKNAESAGKPVSSAKNGSDKEKTPKKSAVKEEASAAASTGARRKPR